MLKLMFMMLFSFFLISLDWVVVISVFFFCFFLFIFYGNYMFVSNISYSLGVDIYSWVLIILSVWILVMMVLSSLQLKRLGKNYNLFMYLLVGMTLVLMYTFSVMNLMFFYIAFESSLVPIFILIFGWGYQPERFQAGLYMLFYTLFASLPLLLLILWLGNKVGGSDFIMLMNLSLVSNIFVYLFFMLAFLVKLPVFLFHLWLPKAHVEAPVSGSMVLAAIMLKLGGYGIFRVLGFLQNMGILFMYLWMSIGLVGSSMLAILCIMQSDLKSLIAYSSVVHMGMVLVGLMSMSMYGVMGAFIVMLGHGLCSSGLFSLVNMVYERSGSRSLLINSGLLMLMPSMGLWWFLLSSSNMSAPPSLNLLGEIDLLISIVSVSLLGVVSVSFILFFSGGYNLYMYSASQHGKSYSGSFSFLSGKLMEFHVMMLHWFPLNYLFLGVFFM